MKVVQVKHLLREMDSFLLLCERDRYEVFSSILRGDLGEAMRVSMRLDTACSHVRALAKEIGDLLQAHKERVPLIEFEFDPKSFKRVETNMRRLLWEMERAAIEEAQAEADHIFEASQASVPVQTEELKASGRTRKEKDGGPTEVDPIYWTKMGNC